MNTVLQEYLKLVQMEGIEPPTTAGYNVYSVALTIDASPGYKIGGYGRTRTFDGR